MADKDPEKILKETLETVEILKDSFNSLGAIIKNTIKDNLFEVDSNAKLIGRTIANDITKGLSSLGKQSEKIVENQNALFKGQINSKDIQKQINDLADREAIIRGDINIAGKNDLFNKTQQRKYQKELNDKIKETRKELEGQLIQSKNIEDSMGNLGKLAEGLNKIPILGQFIKTEDVLTAMRQKAADTGSKFQTMVAGLKAAAISIKDGILDPLTLITFFVKSALTANKESVNLSKNLGYGAANANRVRENFVSIENSSGNINVTTKNLNEAFNELSTTTGFITEYSADALETQIKLTKQLGLTGDEAAGVYKFSVLTGKSSEQTYQSLLKGYVSTRNSLGVGVPFKAALAEAAKVSGQLASNLGNNPEAIIKGVVATRALGTSLEQAKQQGESLLDFQTSIENELKAELITGQQLNLERARAAALMGDQVAVAEELAAQGMTAEKFSRMNVIGQKAFAQALGTTTDELANQLAKREMAIASGKSLAQITAEEADEAARRQDIQTKFNAAIEKVQSIIGNLVAGPLGEFMDSLADGLGIVTKIFGVFGKIFSIIKSIPGVGTLLSGVASVATIGALMALLAKSFLKGTIVNPMITKEISTIGSKGGTGGGGSLMDTILGKKAGGQYKKGGGRVPKGGRTGGMLGKLGNSKGSIAALIAGLGLGYVSDLAEESGNEGLAKALGIGGGILGGAGTGAMLGSIIPGVGNIVGGIAGGIIGGLSSLGDDVESPPGYGDRILSTPKGSIKLNNEDHIFATTNDPLKGGIRTPQATMDLSPLIAAMGNVANSVDRLHDKETVIKMGTKEVGTALMMGSYRSA